jgi:hypothetical protein
VLYIRSTILPCSHLSVYYICINVNDRRSYVENYVTRPLHEYNSAVRRTLHTCIYITPSVRTYQFDRDLCGEGEDVGAGDDAGAGVLQRRLHFVHHREPPRRVVVGRRQLLSGVGHPRNGVQEHRAIAALIEDMHTAEICGTAATGYYYIYIHQLIADACMRHGHGTVPGRSSRGSGGG